jgi:hypothetical protein
LLKLRFPQLLDIGGAINCLYTDMNQAGLLLELDAAMPPQRTSAAGALVEMRVNAGGCIFVPEMPREI